MLQYMQPHMVSKQSLVPWAVVQAPLQQQQPSEVSAWEV